MSSKQTILIVDDDLHVLEVLEARLLSSGYQVHKTTTAKDALVVLDKEPIDLMISDMKMPRMGGMELLTEARKRHPTLPVIFLTAYGTIPEAVTAVQSGAIDYLQKPFDGRELVDKLRGVINAGPTAKTSSPKNSQPDRLFMAKSPAMRKLYEIIEKVAGSNVNVLILGESGVGKERVARLIHQLGARKDEALVVVDCGATPATLLESELFGHVKGSFTHAIRDKKGLIEAADGGTLFLDEIGNISPEMQIRLLRFLEDRKIRRIGDIKEVPVDCRVIAATNSDLLEDIETGKFREDLYYRLRVVTIKIPNLNERKEDIPPLAQHFVRQFCKTHQTQDVELLKETINWLVRYPWPGNVRELKNALEAAVVLCKDGVLTPDDLQLAGLPEQPARPSGARVADEAPLSLEESERITIIRALKQAGGVQKDAAELLGISRRAIHYKIKKYGIDASEHR